MAKIDAFFKLMNEQGASDLSHNFRILRLLKHEVSNYFANMG